MSAGSPSKVVGFRRGNFKLTSIFGQSRGLRLDQLARSIDRLRDRDDNIPPPSPRAPSGPPMNIIGPCPPVQIRNFSPNGKLFISEHYIELGLVLARSARGLSPSPSPGPPLRAFSPSESPPPLPLPPPRDPDPPFSAAAASCASPLSTWTRRFPPEF